MRESVFLLRLRGKTIAFIDWANVYGWTKSLKREVDPQKLYKYLKQYHQVGKINLYYGLDAHPKSKQFFYKAKEIGFNVVSKNVKYIPVALDSSHFKNIFQEIKNSLTSMKNVKTEDIEKISQILNRKVLRRKCDFDMEISIDAQRAMSGNFDSFLFFSGDGDFAPLYKLLAGAGKQVIVIFAHGHLGKEIYQIKRGVFTKAIDRLGADLFAKKNTPSIARGA